VGVSAAGIGGGGESREKLTKRGWVGGVGGGKGGKSPREKLTKSYYYRCVHTAQHVISHLQAWLYCFHSPTGVAVLLLDHVLYEELIECLGA